MLRLAFVFLLFFSGLARAISPGLFPGFASESLSVEVTIPIADKPETVRLKPLLIAPKSAPPWSAIVLPSNCSGLDDRMWHFWAQALHRENIAVVFLDSFNPRGFGSICANQFLLTTGARLQDVHQVLDFLRKDPRFIPQKIALGGHSVGAGTAFSSAYAEVLTLLGRRPDSGYNAFVLAAPNCSLRFRSQRLLGPVLLIGGEKDDWTPVAPCVGALEKAKVEGQSVQIHIVPKAYHTFSTSGVVYSGKVMKWPVDAPAVYLKELSYLARKSRYELESGEEVSFEQMLKKHAGFMGNKMFGAHVAGDWDKAPDVADLTARFLKDLGW